MTRIARACPGARVGWQRQRAWMEVFSSALMTYSSGPSGSPCQVRAYRSSTRAGLRPKSGAVMKIQERCCQGLSASWASQRRTVEADKAGAMPRAVASRASSGHDQRASGVPVSAGSWQARAFPSAAGPRRPRLRALPRVQALDADTGDHDQDDDAAGAQ
ncbi:hypothetical protein [Streptomyces sp. NPDC102437]|uniref:hypothetical protein n=1 Tax=Streptomyces sp. NPDC102437 TaxID=3366175 RepID=UPI003820455B